MVLSFQLPEVERRSFVTQIPCLFFFFSFSFFFYHAFIVSRYKKLRAALAMEKTKPINQNITTKETKYPIHRGV